MFSLFQWNDKMNLENLKKKLQPQLHKFEIEGETLYIHRPMSMDIAKCVDRDSTLIVCVKDENNDPIFSTEDIEGRINLSILDSSHLDTIYIAIMNLYKTSDVVDEIEKK